MADEFQLGSGNWWESSSSSSSSRNLNRYESRVGLATTSTSSLQNNNNNNNNARNFGTWPTEIVDIKARSSMDSVSVSGSSISMLHFPNIDSGQKLPPPHESSPSAGLLPDPNLQIMGLGLSSQTMDWNQALFRVGEKGGEGSGGFRSMLQEEPSNSNFHQQEQQWRHKIYPSAGSTDVDSSRLSLEHSNMSSGSSNVNQPNFPPHHHNQLDSYGFLVTDTQQQHMNYSYPTISSSYGMNTSHDHQLLPSWSNSSNKFPQFLRTSPPKQQPPHLPPQGQLHFSNNAPFWNASSTPMNDIVAAAAVRPSGLFPSSLQSQLTLPNFDEKPKNTSEARDLAIAKKSSNDTSSKRPRNETPAPMPAFKVRKEKMGDRITALQQLVSPFGKTDTASVLSEAMEYIKFLHEQVSLLSTPYMKSGAPMPHAAHQQHQQNPGKSKDPEAPKQDLRSRGLCLVPVSSTFPVTHETAVDFWTPTYGGTFR